ncbi:MAG: transposase [Herminiimonas sp.]|nr:transposase [Herminiimonas sp.]
MDRSTAKAVFAQLPDASEHFNKVYVHSALKWKSLPSEFRQSLVQHACETGVSVSQLAQINNVNFNILFKWCRQFIAGVFAKP